MSSLLPTLEAESQDADTVPTVDLLDWSVSGISGISAGFEKQDRVSEISSSRGSSRVDTPDGLRFEDSELFCWGAEKLIFEGYI